MAPSFVHGKSGHFTLSDAAAAVINYTSGIGDVSLDRSLDTAEITTMGDSDRGYIPGLRGATITVSGHFSSTHAQKLDGSLGHSTALAWIYGPEGNTAGKRKYNGTCFMTSLAYSGSVDGKVDMSFTLQVDGAVTAGTF